MGAEIELADEEAAAIFSAHKIRARLTQDNRSINAFRDTLKWGRDRPYGLFHHGVPAESLVPARGGSEPWWPRWWTVRVGSHCAEGHRALGPTVQPSGSSLTSALPALIIGSMVKVMPALSSRPVPDLP